MHTSALLLSLPFALALMAPLGCDGDDRSVDSLPTAGGAAGAAGATGAGSGGAAGRGGANGSGGGAGAGGASGAGGAGQGACPAQLPQLSDEASCEAGQVCTYPNSFEARCVNEIWHAFVRLDGLPAAGATCDPSGDFGVICNSPSDPSPCNPRSPDRFLRVLREGGATLVSLGDTASATLSADGCTLRVTAAQTYDQPTGPVTLAHTFDLSFVSPTPTGTCTMAYSGACEATISGTATTMEGGF